MPELPQELIDAILEEVPSSSLGACSLTATAFVATSQRRLFRWMSLTDVPSYERAARLLTSSPHLGPYFMWLALDIQHIPKDYPVLKSILAALSSIEHLSIVGAATGPFKSNQIGQNPCLVDFLSLPTLRCFALQNLIDVPASLVARALASFEQVLLFRISIAEDEDAGQYPSLGALWYLGVIDGGYETILPFLLHPKRREFMKDLGRLAVTIPPIPEPLQPRFKELLVACASTLEHLTLELEEPPTYLPPLPEMIFLELWIDVELTKTADLFHSIISATLASTPHLEVLTLAILDRPANPHRPHRQQWTTCAPAEWATLDAMLMDREDLCEVEFSLRHFPNEPERYAAFVPFIQAHLPRLFEAELLTFNYRDLMRHPMDEFAVDY
ncbi:hypothetical protein DFH06DRAFT_1203619 [Mycena polygramma]|nr:hypothetical protein DFH06DRAFT_1203619 [Mycena polygramma]